MKTFLRRSIFFLLISILIYSCQKELTDPMTQPAVAECRITNSYYYGGSGGINDSANFTYSNGKVMRADREEDYVEYIYNGNTLSMMKFYEKQGNTLIRTDSFFFTNNKISRITSLDNDWPNNFDTTYSTIEFSYSGDQLNEVTNTTNYLVGNAVFVSDTIKARFVWNGTGNITAVAHEYVGLGMGDTSYYAYDNQPNYFTALHQYFFMVDPFFQILVGFEAHLPLFISKNNVINYTIYDPPVDYPVEYETDSLLNPTAVHFGGSEYMRYKYVCD